MLKITVPPAGDPLLSPGEIKAHLRIEADDASDDAQLVALGRTALDVIETDVQRAYAERTLKWVLPGFPDYALRFPLAPIVAVEAIDYTGAGGEVHRLDPTAYELRPSGETAAIVPRFGVPWPFVGGGLEPVAITFRAGGATELPPRVRQAALLLVGHYYEHREAVTTGGMAELPQGVEALISPERWA